MQPPQEAIDAIKAILRRHTSHCMPTSRTNGLSSLDTQLLEGWRCAAKHPDSEVCTWLDDGGPAGIKFAPTDSGGIFPACDEPAAESITTLRCDANKFRNYHGVEEHPVTEEELQAHIDEGHLAEFDSYDELSAFVGGTPEEPAILSKLGLIIKIKNGVEKARLILDTKESGVGSRAGKYQRVILPRLFDAILRMLYLMSCLGGAADTVLMAMVLDFTQAFWQLPIKPEERKYFCTSLVMRGKRRYITFLRAAQGSVMAPLLWCRMIALVMCLTQSLFPTDQLNMMCYVDDPLAISIGNPDKIRAMMAAIILTWEALGFKLAYAKGQLGSEITWIGGTLECQQHGVKATVKESILLDIRSGITKALSVNVIPLKELHSLVGRINHAAGLLIIIRPFMEPLWAALHQGSGSSGPHNCVWTRQIKPTLKWFDRFFNKKGERLQRFYSLEAYLRAGITVEIGTDASPWGLGGWLSVGGKVTSYFASKLTADDERRYGHAIANADGQQIWECLAILVAVDLWHEAWAQQRIVLKIKGDNVTALTLLIKMRPKGPKMAIIARELALRLAVLSFPPDAIHTPGIAHIAADALSRVYAPGGPGHVSPSLHHSLSGAVEAIAAPRVDAWYTADIHDSADASAGGDSEWEPWYGHDY